MGERHDGREGVGRRPTRPSRETLTAEALLAAVRPRHLDPEAEARAVAAFREARERRQGVRSPRTRRRDDWRPLAARRTGRSLRTLLAVLLAGAAVGGVAVAAMGNLPHETVPPRPARSDAPASPEPHERPDTTAAASEAPTTGRADAVPDKAAKKTDKAQGKAAKKQDKADRKADKAADKAVGKAAKKAAQATAKSAQSIGQSAQAAQSKKK
ncbi:hypothetical protein ACFOZ0_35170 [Streptomyces yaanensis]|uniref:Uncharacterized protein n=1 Tax=Streptomyces yaanensis TaxID=1142239 RepID=A0ABV7SPP8_9ACTN|nr:hypothetical protein [Streptomyces sp. CGMCC 4.7035]WNB97361.1 hypothetical protein Q2K21_04335 [Streptomyces sp. CGMCC 4.7035]